MQGLQLDPQHLLLFLRVEMTPCSRAPPPSTKPPKLTYGLWLSSWG